MFAYFVRLIGYSFVQVRQWRYQNVVFAVLISFSSFLQNPIYVYPYEALEGFTMALMMTSAVTYVARYASWSESKNKYHGEQFQSVIIKKFGNVAFWFLNQIPTENYQVLAGSFIFSFILNRAHSIKKLSNKILFFLFIFFRDLPGTRLDIWISKIERKEAQLVFMHDIFLPLCKLLNHLWSE